jgi:hypothetical protein
VNDNDLLAAVREDWAPVRLDVSAKTILAAGGARKRRRHQARKLTTAAVVAAGLGLGASALASRTSPPAPEASSQVPIGGHAGTTTLAAWTVVSRPDGTVAVTIRDLRNINGLQQRLNADHVHAVVYTRVHHLPGCLDVQEQNRLGGTVTIQAARGPDDVYFVVHPAAIPPGTSLEVDVVPAGWPAPDGPRLPPGARTGFSVGFNGGSNSSGADPSISLTLVYANGAC